MAEGVKGLAPPRWSSAGQIVECAVMVMAEGASEPGFFELLLRNNRRHQKTQQLSIRVHAGA